MNIIYLFIFGLDFAEFAICAYQVKISNKKKPPVEESSDDSSDVESSDDSDDVSSSFDKIGRASCRERVSSPV